MNTQCTSHYNHLQLLTVALFTLFSCWCGQANCSAINAAGH